MAIIDNATRQKCVSNNKEESVMLKKFAAGVLIAGFTMAVPAYASDAPDGYKKCKMCHGNPGEGAKKLGPDLVLSNLDAVGFAKMVDEGSTWEGRPARVEGFETKKMPAQKGLTAEDITAIYEYVQAAK
jgi:hypothetical protein